SVTSASQLQHAVVSKAEPNGDFPTRSECGRCRPAFVSHTLPTQTPLPVNTYRRPANATIPAVTALPAPCRRLAQHRHRLCGRLGQCCRAASAPRHCAPPVRVGLPPIIVPGLKSEISSIITLAAPTGDRERTSYSQLVRTGSDGTSHKE